jgi:predicted DNA-binding transcriptional regulator YafY
MLRLHELLAANRYPNCRKMADEFEVSPKTVQRDINFMRDRLGLPIDYDEALFGFRYTRPVQSFPANLTPAAKPPPSMAGSDTGPSLSAPLQKSAANPRKGRLVVRIHFDAKAAAAIQERQWHPSQEITPLGDGRIEFTLRLDSFAGIEPWILSWGAHACVIEPDRLRRRILRIARAIVARS